MTKPIRRIHDAAFKTKVVLEALKGLKTLPQLASEVGIHPQQITDWKKQALDQFPSLFENGPLKPILSEQQREEIEAPLFQQIGQLKVENDWLKKNCGPVEAGSSHSDRPHGQPIFRCATMRPIGPGPLQLLLPAGRRVGAESGDNEAH